MRSVLGGTAGQQAAALGNIGGYTGRGGGNVIPSNRTRPPRPGELTIIDKILLGNAGVDPNSSFTYQRGSETINFPGGMREGGGRPMPRRDDWTRQGQINGLRDNTYAPGPVGMDQVPQPPTGPQFRGGRMPGSPTVFNMGQLDPSKIQRRVG